MRRHVAIITGAAASGAGGVGARGVPEWVGDRAIDIFTAPVVGGCTCAVGIMATGSFAAFGAAGDRRN